MVLVDVADATQGAAVADRPAEPKGLAGRQLAEGQEDFDQRGLAGAVRAEDAEHLARLDGEGDARHGPALSDPEYAERVVLGDVLELDRVVRRHREGFP